MWKLDILLKLLNLIIVDVWIIMIVVELIDYYLNWWYSRGDMKGPKAKTPHHYSKLTHSTAVHEAAHAVVASYCSLVSRIDKVITDQPEGGGWCHYFIVDRDTPNGRWCEVVIALAGMAAEISMFGSIHSSACKKDLECAFRHAAELEEANQLEPPWNIEDRTTKLPFHKMFVKISSKQQAILERAYSMAHTLLRQHDAKYHQLVSVLMKEKNINQEQVEAVLGSRLAIKFLKTPFVLRTAA